MEVTLDILCGGQGKEDVRLLADEFKLAAEHGSPAMAMPQRQDAVGLGNFSHVLSTPLRCYPNSPLPFHSLVVRGLQWL